MRKSRRKNTLKKIKTKKALPRLAITDHLTGLYNRRYFDQLLKKTIVESKKTKNHFSLLMIDINNFKKVNDQYGHLAGDRILIDVAKILKKSVRRADICFRYGGDEITIILPQTTKEVAEHVASRLKTKVEAQTFSITDEDTLHLGLSMGLAFFPDDGLKHEVLIKRADEALYRVKRQKQRRIEPFILLTKLTPPVLKETVVSRPHLFSMLKEHCNKKLMCIVADAGYGKTTLLTQFIKDQKLTCVFYDLEHEDSDVMVFLSYLLHALEQLQPGSVQRTRGLLEQGPEVVKNYELVMGTLINEFVEKCKRTIFLILDDYHTIADDSVVHRALDYLIDNLPRMVRVVLASRTIPQLPNLSKWRSKQDVFELTRDNLKFTQDEVASLLTDVYRLMLSDEELKNVADHTEGWVTGIQLVLQAVGKDKKTVRETLNGYMAAHQPLFDYFANEVLRREPVKLQNFLTCSSILEVMTPEACTTVFGTKKSSQVLQELEKRNLFISVIGKYEYKYHHLFRDFLQGRIEDTELKKSLNLKAAKYYKKREKIEQAIHHYLAAGHYKRAVTFIVQIADTLEGQARFATLSKWLKQIPDIVIQKNPLLMLIQGSLYRVQGQMEKAEKMFIKAQQPLRERGNISALTYSIFHEGVILWMTGTYEQALKTLRRALTLCPTTEAKMRGNILNLMGVVWNERGDFKKSRTYLKKAFNVFKQYKDSTEFSMVLHNLAGSFFAQGENKRAFRAYESLIEKIKNHYGLQIGVGFSCAVRTAIAYGKVDWAEQCINQGWTLCRPYQDPWSTAALYEGFGFLYMQKEHWELAEKYMQKALDCFTQLQWRQSEFVLLKTLCSIYRYIGNVSKAEEYFELARQKIDDMESALGVQITTELALLQVAQGQFDKAEKNVEIILRLLQQFERKASEFLALLARTAINISKNKERKAIKSLRRAIQLSKTKGYDGILMREFRHMPQLIDFAQRHGIEKNYLLSLNLAHLKPEIKITVQCFGGLQLKDEKGVVLPFVWPTEKTQSMFAFLVTHRETPIRRETLIETLWPGFPKDRASINFRTTATRMRQTISNVFSKRIDQKQIFVCHHGKYQLLPNIQFHVDSEEFTLLLKETERASSPGEKEKSIEQPP
jgi:LuxR family maltose regulon positive regulatory protein